jgi:hypothetical protein
VGWCSIFLSFSERSTKDLSDRCPNEERLSVE